MSVLDIESTVVRNSELTTAWSELYKQTLEHLLILGVKKKSFPFSPKCIVLPEYASFNFIQEQIRPKCNELDLELFCFNACESTYNNVKIFINMLENQASAWSNNNKFDNIEHCAETVYYRRNSQVGVVLIENISEIPQFIENYKIIVNLLVHNWKNHFDWMNHFFISFSIRKNKGSFDNIWQACDNFAICNLKGYMKK